MAYKEDEDDVRGAKPRKVVISGSDAEAYIKARREEREMFQKLEGKDLDGHDAWNRSEEGKRIHENNAKAGQERDDAEKKFHDDRERRVEDAQKLDDVNRERGQQQQEQQRGRTL